MVNSLQGLAFVRQKRPFICHACSPTHQDCTLIMQTLECRHSKLPLPSSLLSTHNPLASSQISSLMPFLPQVGSVWNSTSRDSTYGRFCIPHEHKMPPKEKATQPPHKLSRATPMRTLSTSARNIQCLPKHHNMISTDLNSSRSSRHELFPHASHVMPSVAG